MSTTLIFKKPKLKDGYKLVEYDNNLEIHYKGEEFVISGEGEDLSQIKVLLNLLNGENSLEMIQERLPGWTIEDVNDVLIMLDQAWLLSEGESTEFNGCSGLELILECEDLQRYLERQKGETKITSALVSGNADKRLLYGFAFEYYHVTSRAHGSIAPALSYLYPRQRKSTLRKFFVEEYRHDDLIMKSLMAAGFSKAEIVNSVPLPYTNAVCNLLSAFANQDPLSFMAVLFIFEGKPWEEDIYIKSLEQYDVPDDFVTYQRIHSEINQKGEHGLVSRELFKTIDYISQADKIRILKNIGIMMDTLFRMYDGIYDYYQNPSNPLPRLI
jgi:pyrroloquinoline quinone (PQQ) biosynthesis protein C